MIISRDLVIISRDLVIISRDIVIISRDLVIISIDLSSSRDRVIYLQVFESLEIITISREIITRSRNNFNNFSSSDWQTLAMCFRTNMIMINLVLYI